LGSYTAQAELGDYNEFDHGTTYEYLNNSQFAPIQDEELLRRIHEQHKRHKYIVFHFSNYFLIQFEYLEVNHQMPLIYIFLRMQRN
jgi:hypothetical protein